MTRMDVNGNTVSKNETALRRLVKQANGYAVDSYGRVMVEDGKGGMVVFFEQDEPTLAKWVFENLELN